MLEQREGGRAPEHLLSSGVFIFAERCRMQSLIKLHMSGLASGTVCVCVLEGDSVCESERGGGVHVYFFFYIYSSIRGQRTRTRA